MKIVCNIPHSGLIIPKWALKDFIQPIEFLECFHNKMVDKNVDLLFDFITPEHKVVSYLSRIVVDMERYRMDKDEPMSKLGMGLYYTKDDLGNLIRVKGSSHSTCLAAYDHYHQELEDKVENVLREFNECLILDCHSFHEGQTYTGYPINSYPDICIGFNGDTSPKEAELIKQFFQGKGYTVSYNMPFEGALAPTKYINDSRVTSVMIELNRKIYDESFYDFEKVHGYLIELLQLLK